MNLVIDIGNTKAKIAIFNNNELLERLTVDVENIIAEVKLLQKRFSLTNCIVSSVTKFDITNFKEIDFQTFIRLNHTAKVPFINNYKSPLTLGVDRIALASAAVKEYPKQNVLVIDAGTCITYDFVTENKEYLGGAISPGIDMRYKSLHTFTANLPLLEKDDFKLIGTDTQSSIHSGILNGVINEIEGIINQYIDKYQTLTVVLTGGDTNFLSKKLKNTIFANPNFLLVGLNSILTYNIDE